MAFNKTELIDRLNALGFPKSEVILTFDEFFEGNEIENSLSVNIPWKPSITEFRITFQSLLDSQLATNVFIRIVDIDDPEEWVYSDTIYVVGDLSMTELAYRIKNLKPDGIETGWYYGLPVNIGAYDQSKNIYTIYWD